MGTGRLYLRQVGGVGKPSNTAPQHIIYLHWPFPVKDSFNFKPNVMLSEQPAMYFYTTITKIMHAKFVMNILFLYLILESVKIAAPSFEVWEATKCSSF